MRKSGETTKIPKDDAVKVIGEVVQREKQKLVP
jgi:hypothetical protein